VSRGRGDGGTAGGLTISVLGAGHARAEISIVVADGTEDGVAHALVHGDGDGVGAADEEVDEERAVGRLGGLLEARAEAGGEREPPVLGRDGHGCDVPVPVGVVAFCLADDCGGSARGGEYLSSPETCGEDGDAYCSPSCAVWETPVRGRDLAILRGS
jgi:hypothetical protein